MRLRMLVFGKVAHSRVTERDCGGGGEVREHQ